MPWARPLTVIWNPLRSGCSRSGMSPTSARAISDQVAFSSCSKSAQRKPLASAKSLVHTDSLALRSATLRATRNSRIPLRVERSPLRHQSLPELQRAGCELTVTAQVVGVEITVADAVGIALDHLPSGGPDLVRVDPGFRGGCCVGAQGAADGGRAAPFQSQLQIQSI